MKKEKGFRAAWAAIVKACDPWLDAVTDETLVRAPIAEHPEVTFGNLLLRTTYHYWYHTGENMAIRQALGHTELEEFVGDIDAEAPYQPHAVGVGP